MKGGLGDRAYMQILSCENSDVGGRIVSDKATGSQSQYQSDDEKRVADDPGNVREGSRGKKINGLWRAGWFNRDKTPHRSYRDRLCTITKIVARARNAGRECSRETRRDISLTEAPFGNLKEMETGKGNKTLLFADRTDLIASDDKKCRRIVDDFRPCPPRIPLQVSSLAKTGDKNLIVESGDRDGLKMFLSLTSSCSL